MAEITDDLKSIRSVDTLSQAELIRAIRVSIKAEIDAVHLYTMIAEATDNEQVKAIMLHTAQEERVHIGEFLKALQLLEPQEFSDYNEGADEVEELLGIGNSNTPQYPTEDLLTGLTSKLDESLKK